MNKKLTRSTDDKMVSGVAAGLADYMNIDPVLVRLFFVLAALSHSYGLLIYFLLWIMMPQEKLTEKISVG